MTNWSMRFRRRARPASSGELNDQVAQTATVSPASAQDIAVVNDTLASMSSGGQQIRTSATELSVLSEQLRSVVGQFKI